MFFAAFVALTILLLWVFQVVFLDDFYKSIKQNEIKNYASKIKQNINSDNLSDIVTQIATDGDLSAIIVKENGEVRVAVEGSAGSLIFRMPTNQFNNYYRLAKENGGIYMEYFEGFNTGRRTGNDFFADRLRNNERPATTMIYVVTQTVSDGSEEVILLNTNITPVDSTVQTIRLQLVFITVILLLIALFMALLISKIISKPIMDINKSSKELAKGNYDASFSNKGYKEISELAETLNYAAEELSKVDRLKTELIANISHDLRTPLTLITGYSEAMKELPGQNTPENLQIIVDESKRLSSLVTDMMSISKLQSGAESLNLSEFSITKCVEELCTRFSKLTEKYGYKVEFSYDSFISVFADETKITQVVYNLVNNAITHTGEDKTVNVRQSVLPSGYVRIEIIDSGEGIAKENLPEIWERYYKIDKEHKRTVTGTGLGLSIVKTIFDLHKIHYGVTSEQGRGSNFWFDLKISEQMQYDSL